MDLFSRTFAFVLIFLSSCHAQFEYIDQSIKETEACIGQFLDLVLVVDSSESMMDSATGNHLDNWTHVRRTLTSLIASLPSEQYRLRVGLVRYSSSASIIFHPHMRLDKITMMDLTSNMEYVGGNTNTSGALRMIRRRMFSPYRTGFRRDSRKIVVLISDGVSNIEPHLTLAEARELKSQDIQLFVVAVGQEVNLEQLQEMASDPLWYHSMHVHRYDQIYGIIRQLAGRLCEPISPPVANCSMLADVAIVVDGSSSIREKNPVNSTEDNWESILKFATDIIRSLDVRENAVRVSLVKFSSNSEVVFQLNKYENGEDMRKRIESLDFTFGGTNTADALRTLDRDVFTEQHGDRQNVVNIGILITDGESTVDKHLTKEEAEKLKRKGIRMFVVGVTDQIVEEELKIIASEPSVDHIFYAEFDKVEELVGRLITYVCNEGCGNSTEGVDCSRKLFTELNPDCTKGVIWDSHPGRIMLGHNIVRLQHITNALECKRLCLKDPRCKSVDYYDSWGQCSLSDISRVGDIDNFVADLDTDYYEWRCH